MWPNSQELSADDTWNYFQAFGEIVDFDWLEDGQSDNTEVVRVFFSTSRSVGEALQMRKHNVPREADEKVVCVSVHVKFSDNLCPNDARWCADGVPMVPDGVAIAPW